MKETDIIYIKNMVCNRCIKVVREELERLGITPLSVTLGEVHLLNVPNEEQLVGIRNSLAKNGFEQIDTANTIMIEKIKTSIIELIHYTDNSERQFKYSDYIQKEVGRDYHSLSALFSSVEGITIEKYIILQKTERVKELMVYGELSLSEIAYQTGYSSVAHLSNQFKKTTGLTPTHFKTLRGEKRKPLDKV